MKVSEATIDIDAPRAVVWQHLTDFSSYPEWNPFIISAKGELKQGGAVRIKAARVPIPMTAHIVSLIPEEELIWEAQFPLPGFQPRYIRRLQTLEDGRTHFINREEFTGPLVLLMTPVLLIMADLYPKMCEALKQRAEAAASP